MAEAIIEVFKNKEFYHLISTGMKGIRSIAVEAVDSKEELTDLFIKYAVIVGEEIYPDYHELILGDKFDDKYITVFGMTNEDCRLKLILEARKDEE